MKSDNIKLIREKMEFWKPLVYTKGKLDERKVMNELSDYKTFLDECARVYYAVTQGRISKQNTRAEEVIGQFEELFWPKAVVKDDVKEMIKDYDTIEDLREELQRYFEIDF